MPSVLVQCTAALQQKRFTEATALAGEALASADAATRLALLEVLAQAQTGLQDHTAAAQTWQRAYEQAATPADKARLFERTSMGYQSLHDYPMLLELAQTHLRHVRSAQERAACLLLAGEALFHLQRYREARQQCLEPAVRLVEAAAYTRVGLWQVLGRCHLAEHAFTAAAEAFRQSIELIRGMSLNRRTPHVPELDTQLHHLCNTARFYDGIIHLVYHRPQQTVQTLQILQPPLTALGARHSALFLGLAYRQLQQPEAADRALHPLTRTSAVSDILRGPCAVICAGIANLRQDTAAVGACLEVALSASLVSRTPWEPSWRAWLYQELGLALWRTGYRQAAIACYEDGLKAILHQWGIWDDPHRSDWLRGPSLLTALENLPLHTWSATIQGEMLRLLQGLAWLYNHEACGMLAEAALTLALRLALTPEQQAHLWLHRGWLAAIAPAGQQPGPGGVSSARGALLLEVQRARAHCAPAPLARALQGVEALLQGNEALALACFAQVPTVPGAPVVQALSTAAWLWAQARQGTLEQALKRTHKASLPWQTDDTLVAALEMLLVWTSHMAASTPEAIRAWLVPILAQSASHTGTALRRLCRPGALPTALRAALTTALTPLLSSAPHAELADEAAALLGGSALLDRIAALLMQLDQYTVLTPPPQVSRRRKQPHQDRRAPTGGQRAPEIARVLRLIELLAPACSTEVEPLLPEVIRDWLMRYQRLGRQAPEVVGALLGVLRQCSGAHVAMRIILDQVPLSQRQRHVLEAAIPTPPPATAATPDLLAWEPIRSWSLTRLFDTLMHLRTRHAVPSGSAVEAQAWYLLAMVFARVGLHARARACAHTCLNLQPGQPLVHFLLSQLYRLQHQYEAAWQHIRAAWQGLTQVPQVQVVHLEVLNRLLGILSARPPYDDFPRWLATFERCRADLEPAALDESQRQRLREVEGECALSQALYLALAPSVTQTTEILEQQLALLAQAIAQGSLSTQYVALHRQAETLAHLQRLEDAAGAYAQVLQQWPEDRRARLGIALLTAMRQATEDVAATAHALAEALTLAFAGTRHRPSPLTVHTALTWLQRAAPRDPGCADVADVLTISGCIAVQQGEAARALEILVPLHALTAQPRQAYYLAEAYALRCQQAVLVADQLSDCAQALQYAQQALHSSLSRQRTSALLQQIQEQYDGLTAVQRHTVALLDYRDQVCRLFQRYGVLFQVEVVAPAADVPWLELHEMVDLDDRSGDPIVTVRLYFNASARGTVPTPEVSEVTLYAQHQHEVQRLVVVHSMAAVPWPPLAYTGSTAFDLLFPERLALNRDLLFVLYAAPRALRRYARVLQQTTRTVSALCTTDPPPSVTTLAAVARWAVMVPLVSQCLQPRVAATAAPGYQQPPTASQQEVLPAWLLEQLQHFPVFADAYAYFHQLVETLRPLLNAPPAEPLRMRAATEDLFPPTRRRQPPTRIPRGTRRASLSMTGRSTYLEV
jgi:tetratricopeptide (TPR) repeat protein